MSAPMSPTDGLPTGGPGAPPASPPPAGVGSPPPMQGALSQMQPQMSPQQAPQQPGGPDSDDDPAQTVTIDDVMELLRDEQMRNFRIDVETDQMIQPDEQAEKQAATELVTAVGQFLGTFGPMVKEMPQLAPLAGEMLLFAFRRFRAGRDLEETVEKTMRSVSTAIQNPPPPQPDPTEMAKIEREKMAGQAELARGQQDIQKGQQDMALKAQQHQQDQAAKQAERDMQVELQAREHQAKLLEMKAGHDRDQAAADAQHRREIEAHLAAMERMRLEEQREMARHQREMERMDREAQHREREAEARVQAAKKTKKEGGNGDH